MSTRAIVAMRLQDDSILATYLHFDGYPDRVLPILRDGYADPDEALELIEGGEIRTLHRRPEMPEYFANSRPRTELSDATKLERLAEYLNAEHLYLMNEKGWTHRKV